jgi:hypothetical protein
MKAAMPCIYSIKSEPDNRGQAMKMDRKVGRQAFEVDQKVGRGVFKTDKQ